MPTTITRTGRRTTTATTASAIQTNRFCCESVDMFSLHRTSTRLNGVVPTRTARARSERFVEAQSACASAWLASASSPKATYASARKTSVNAAFR
ncbi:hypothetical protein ACFQJD_16905 [Haloplanus sp. GCM10025708]|uniref:hypothetical protein n=1 Tax=Haloplanus sp. GCM10025708 TaxID=3252679 RepID=UPI00361B0386